MLENNIAIRQEGGGGMQRDGYKLNNCIELAHSSEYYLEKDFGALVDLFLKYLNNEQIEIYNEDSLKFELGTFLRIVFSDYIVSFEKNISCFVPDTKMIKHEIDIVIYPKNKKKIQENDKVLDLIDPTTAYAIELKFPSFRIVKVKNDFVYKYNQGGNKILENLEKDMLFVAQLFDKGFKNAWSFVLVPQIAKSIYQVPTKSKNDSSKIYYKFRGFSAEEKELWNNGMQNANPYQIKWFDWKNENGDSLGKYYIKSAKNISINNLENTVDSNIKKAGNE